MILDIAAEHNSVVSGRFIVKSIMILMMLICSINLNKVSEIKSEETDEFLRFLCWFLVRYFHLDHYAPDLKAAPMI